MTTQYYSNGEEIKPYDSVTYSPFDETEVLQDIKPLQPYLKGSKLVIGEFDDNLEIRWMYGNKLKNIHAAKLDPDTAKILVLLNRNS